MNRNRRLKKANWQRGVFLLPNIVTSLNLFCGFYAIIVGIQGMYHKAAIAVLVAGLFDNLDGKIARATHTTSRFGVEYDSLADLVAFGLAPGLIMYLWALQPFGRMGWLAAFLFVACGALRLARFNTQAGTISSAYFVGLPIPAAAGMSMVTLLLYQRMGVIAPANPYVVLVEMYVLSFLMVSNVPYESFKKRDLANKKSFNSLVVALLVLMVIATEPWIGLFLCGMVYVLSGPVSSIVKRSKKWTAKEISEPESINPTENQI
jgi:CDP-diacylglycerol---serine O-phosphatidyltransferase